MSNYNINTKTIAARMDAHDLWLESKGTLGKRAQFIDEAFPSELIVNRSFCKASFSNVDFGTACFENCDFRGSDFTSSCDISMAEFVDCEHAPNFFGVSGIFEDSSYFGCEAIDRKDIFRELGI